MSSNTQGNTHDGLLGRIGHLTRQLREGMRELGLDKQVERAAQTILDARDRLNYVAAMTERAAHRALNAIDVAQPMQEALSNGAKDLSGRWDQWFANPIVAGASAMASTAASATLSCRGTLGSPKIGAVPTSASMRSWVRFWRRASRAGWRQ
jgi:chemotaxis regulatin CheY-phosphate phosphatase CheZ